MRKALSVWMLALSLQCQAQSLPGVKEELLKHPHSAPYLSGYSVLFPGYPFSDCVVVEVPPQARERVFETCRQKPELYPAALGELPDREEVWRDMFAKCGDDPDCRGYLRRRLPELRAELIAAARAEVPLRERESDLVALAKVDFSAAKPILEKLQRSGDEWASLFARKQLLLKEGSDAQLRDFVLAHPMGSTGLQELDFRLFSKRWPHDRDFLEEFFATDDSRWSLEGVLKSDIWVPVMFSLLESTNPRVRARAASVLFESERIRPEILARAVRPWLVDEDWLEKSSAPYRGHAVRLWQKWKDPGSVEALRAIYAATQNQTLRRDAAEALRFQTGEWPEGARDWTAASFLDFEALLESGELTREDLVRALEAKALGHARTSEEKEWTEIGRWLEYRYKAVPGLEQAVRRRVTRLEKEEPQLAAAIVDESMKCRAVGGTEWCLEYLAQGRARPSMIKFLLDPQKRAEKEIWDFSDAGSLHGEALGVWASLPGQEADKERVMTSTDTDAQAMLLACACYQREGALPVSFVAKSYADPTLHDKALEFILASADPKIRDLVAPKEVEGKFFGPGDRDPDDEERAVLSEMGRRGATHAVLLRRSDLTWALPESSRRDSGQENLLIFPSEQEWKAWLAFAEKTQVEGRPSLVWRWAMDHYLLSVFSPERNWRLGFVLMPEPIEKRSPFVRLSQRDYRAILNELEKLGTWETVRSEQ